MAMEINPATGICECVDCVNARYDMALLDVREAKVALADAFMEWDTATDWLIDAGPNDAADALVAYTKAFMKRSEALKEVKRLQDVANKALDALIARKAKANGEANG